MDVNEGGSTATTDDNVSDESTEDKDQDTHNPLEDQLKEAARVRDQFKQDMFKFKNRTKELESELEQLRQQRLREKEDFKSLYETESENHKKTKERADRLQSNVFYSEKYRSVYPTLKKMGLIDDGEKILDKESLDDLEVETTTEGRFIVHGVDTFAEKFKGEYPFLFNHNRPPNVNAGGGTTDKPTKVTPELLVELETRDPEKYRKYLKIYLEQRKNQVRS